VVDGSVVGCTMVGCTVVGFTMVGCTMERLLKIRPSYLISSRLKNGKKRVNKLICI